MQAIITKYVSPTNFKGARISAKCDAGSVTISYPYGESESDAHALAVTKLKEKLGWSGEMVGGGLPNNTGMAWVFTNKHGSPKQNPRLKKGSKAAKEKMAALRAKRKTSKNPREIHVDINSHNVTKRASHYDVAHKRHTVTKSTVFVVTTKGGRKNLGVFDSVNSAKLFAQEYADKNKKPVEIHQHHGK